MSAVDTGIRQARQFVGGTWVAAASGRTFDDVDPFTGDVVAHVPAGGREDARRAIETAAAAFPAWAGTPPGVRQGIFLRAADALEARRDEVVSLLARETGCTFGFGMFQMGSAPEPAAPGRRAPVRAARRGDPVGHGRVRDGRAAAGRRRRRDRAVERGADPVRAVDRGGARAREQRRAEAVRALTLWLAGSCGARSSPRPASRRACSCLRTHEPGAAGEIGDELIESPHVRRLNFTG